MNDAPTPQAVPATAQRSGEYWVLVPHDAGEVAVVNATGYQVFTHCDGSRSEADIVRTIADASGADVERVKHDVAAFVQRLESAGLLVGGS